MAQLSLTIILIIITCGISIMALNQSGIIEKLIMNPYITERKHEYYRFITSGFIHANYMHLGFNMLSFYFFGEIVEAWLGGTRFLILYLAAIVVSEIPTYLKYKNDSRYNSLGASGGVSAIIFASIILYPTNFIFIYFIPVPAFLFGFLYLFYSFYMDRQNNGHINHSAHLYGAMFGVLFIVVSDPLESSKFFLKILEGIQRVL